MTNSSQAAPALTLYSRAWCHLCHDMEEGLRRLQADVGFTFSVVDVDADEALEQRLGEDVPVLEANGKAICKHFLDEAAVRAYLLNLR